MTNENKIALVKQLYGAHENAIVAFIQSSCKIECEKLEQQGNLHKLSPDILKEFVHDQIYSVINWYEDHVKSLAEDEVSTANEVDAIINAPIPPSQ